MKFVAIGLFFLTIPAFANDDASTELIGGRAATPSEWPASVYASMGGSRCSATVVGEKVLYIAAHCVDNGGSATFSAGANSYTGRCTHSPKYAGNATADWALCVLSQKVEGVPYEVVNIDPTKHVIGQEVLLTGYGCTQQGGGGGNDGTYRIGEAKITQIPSGSSNDIVTRGTAALCFGDSGGPAFLYLDAAKTKRVLISINSRGDIRTTSYLSSVSTPDALAFARDFSTRNSVKICGMHADALGCRGAAVTPGLPDECSGLESQLDVWKSCLTAKEKPAQESCDGARDVMLACVDARYN